jgi:hypothetical protein
VVAAFWDKGRKPTHDIVTPFLWREADVYSARCALLATARRAEGLLRGKKSFFFFLFVFIFILILRVPVLKFPAFAGMAGGVCPRRINSAAAAALFGTFENSDGAPRPSPTLYLLIYHLYIVRPGSPRAFTADKYFVNRTKIPLCFSHQNAPRIESHEGLVYLLTARQQAGPR